MSKQELLFWYNRRTGEVETGPQSLAIDRIGPFKTAAEAARALEIIEERAAKWAREDAEED
ncbi:SPOR domain-containing protein [Lysinibacter sp. HNR]|uniref:SPOR domain-containing protein n=1 Tax=Lysinibacter sp. HNR TaxID=3031408 RepID=UPI0024348CE8|nr:SPOR domain-containing protein [Lysinibacter sp. HNR]WGD36162.1 SPOR domain-containing protein [Lysinibacter sp. HNR]